MTAEWEGVRLTAAGRRPAARSTMVTPDVRELVMHPELELVFRSQYLHVVAVANRVLHSRAEAEDVAQDVFVSFARSQIPASEARGWLTVAATHTALNALRSERRRVTREMFVADSADAPDAASQVIALAEQQRVRDALARLPRKQAVVLVLRHSGLSYADIAEETHLSPNGVGTTLRRAEAALRKELSDEASV